ncbi:hypothetical protein ACSYAY_09850 [Leptospirillum ferriphilum]|jgi:hypothetical protein|uniref:Uncharacterized protein n=2 Tax=Leptospirillum TaxID=179 RepID=A0A094W919_9BACT|nr:hypothetical protein [Leptospirillum ferriphilum]EDZ39261.1 MAG: Protein of unknown function [Leptospirillum sp. Group II '5-way CG']KGA93000.1 hypothetical protein LptCag_0860 [Leptospirillum ferriphilum]
MSMTCPAEPRFTRKTRIPGGVFLTLLALSLLLVPPAFLTDNARGAEKYRLHVVKVSPRSPVSGKPVRLWISAAPAPTRKNPGHFHLYIDQKMTLMFTMTGRSVMIRIPAQSPGPHQLVFIEANPLTHQPMGNDMSMSGMSDMEMDHSGNTGMGGMESALSSIPESARLLTMTLVVHSPASQKP